MNWRNRAVCRAEEPELFFPPGTPAPDLERLRRAKSVCQRCPVTSECLAWALQTDQRAGVWGGLSEDERRQLRPVAADTPTPLVLLTVYAGVGRYEEAGERIFTRASHAEIPSWLCESNPIRASARPQDGDGYDWPAAGLRTERVALLAPRYGVELRDGRDWRYERDQGVAGGRRRTR